MTVSVELKPSEMLKLMYLVDLALRAYVENDAVTVVRAVSRLRKHLERTGQWDVEDG